MKSILDPAFRYVPSDQTDLREAFARIRREQRAREQPDALAKAQAIEEVLIIAPRREAQR